MRAAFLLLLAPLVASAAVETRLNDSSSRYATMLEQSPFALATAVEAPKEPTESFTANWELTSLARLRDANGQEKDFVTIRSRDRRLSFTLLGDQEATEDDAKGVSIHSVNRQDGSRKSTVMLKRGNETGEVKFSEESSAPPAAPMPGAAGAGGAANQARIMQMQQQQLQQAQQARVQQMQNQLTYGSNKLPAVVNPAMPATGIQRPPVNGVFQPGIGPNGLKAAAPAGVWNPAGNVGVPSSGGVVYPQPASPTVVPGAPDSNDPRRRLRVINTRQ